MSLWEKELDKVLKVALYYVFPGLSNSVWGWLWFGGSSEQAYSPCLPLSHLSSTLTIDFVLHSKTL